MIKQKGKAKFLIPLVLILTSVFLLSSFIVLFTLKKQEETQSFDGQILAGFSGGGTSTNPYLIQSKSDLNSFAVHVANGNTCAGQYWELTTDLDYTNTSFMAIGATMTESQTNQTYTSSSAFKGNFNGGGFTVSNLNLNISGGPSNTYANVGFFAKLGHGAQVSNLKIQNFTIDYSKCTSNAYWFVGGIAGSWRSENGEYSTSTTISQCAVENFNVITTSTSYSVMMYDSISAMVGMTRYCHQSSLTTSSNRLVISNCSIKDYNVTSNRTTYRANFSPAYSIAVNTSYGSYTENTFYFNESISNCVKNGGVSEYRQVNKNSTSYTNIHTEAKKLTGLSWSGNCGPNSSVATTWFYNEGYKDGWPQIRVLMKWKTISFSAGEGGTIDLNSVVVPADTNEIYTSTSPSLVVFDKRVTATPNTNFDFIEWQANGTNAYIAIFRARIYRIRFASVDNTTTNVSLGDFYYIYANEEVKLESVYEYSTNKYKSVRFVVKDIFGATSYIRYTADAKYYINGANENVLAETIGTTIDAETGTEITFVKTIEYSVDLYIKQYNVEFH